MFLNKYSESQVDMFKALGHFQEACWLYYDKDTVSVFSEDSGVTCINPWSDGMNSLSNEEAVEEWGERLMLEWCEKAEAYIKSRKGGNGEFE